MHLGVIWSRAGKFDFLLLSSFIVLTSISAEDAPSVTAAPFTSAPFISEPTVTTLAPATVGPVTAAPVTLAPIASSPLPPDLQPKSNYRCGVSELDARANCKKECTTSADCESPDEFCWATFSSYCYIMPEGHPQCNPDLGEQIQRRCGFDEQAARSFCGQVCVHSTDCSMPGEKCFPVQLNLCDCFADQDEERDEYTRGSIYLGGGDRRLENDTIYYETNAEYFERAKVPLVHYFTFTDDSNPDNDLSAPDAGENINNLANAEDMSSADVKNRTMFGLALSFFFVISSLYF